MLILLHLISVQNILNDYLVFRIVLYLDFSFKFIWIVIQRSRLMIILHVIYLELFEVKFMLSRDLFLNPYFKFNYCCCRNLPLHLNTHRLQYYIH